VTTAFEHQVDDVGRWYWEGLAAGELRFQRCRNCHTPWLPPREQCSNCLSDVWDIEQASGAATLVSWVVYHVAPHPAFNDRVPYNVAIVELEEGVRTVTNLSGVSDWDSLRTGAPLEVVFDNEQGIPLARFVLAPGGTE
jgi:uncharacterized protein